MVGPISEALKLTSSKSFSIIVCNRLAPIFSTFWFISVAKEAIESMPSSLNSKSTFVSARTDTSEYESVKEYFSKALMSPLLTSSEEKTLSSGIYGA